MADAAIGMVFFAAVWGFVILCVLASILLTAFWIWMLVDAVRREDYHKENDKIMWVLVIALTGFIGAAVYYVVVRKKLV